jgi:hypothetical protein
VVRHSFQARKVSGRQALGSHVNGPELPETVQLSLLMTTRIDTAECPWSRLGIWYPSLRTPYRYSSALDPRPRFLPDKPSRLQLLSIELFAAACPRPDKMGASDSKLVFKKGIFRLSEERHIPADDPYWTSASGKKTRSRQIANGSSSGNSPNPLRTSLVSLLRPISAELVIEPSRTSKL